MQKHSRVLMVALMIPSLFALSGCPTRGGKLDIQLALSIPKETTLGNVSGVPAADQVWIDMIDSAKETIEFGEFYAANSPGSLLENVIQAVERAGNRGVKIRFVFEKGMIVNDQPTYDRLAKMKNVEWRAYNIKPITGGIIHAKYFVVDAKDSFIGSQNFDWRALDQIHETGARVKDEIIGKQLQAVFEIDWKICETGQAPTPPAPAPNPTTKLEAELVASPPQFNPPGVRPSLTALLELINGAQKVLKVQVMNYSTKKGAWTELDDALRAAAKRGVTVQLLVANWALGSADDFKALIAAGVDVRYTVIPEHSSGCIPYSRLVHSKFTIADDEGLFMSTSNWERGYFNASRNVDFVFHRKDLAAQAHAIFDQMWTSSYANKIEQTGTYSRPNTDCTGVK